MKVGGSFRVLTAPIEQKAGGCDGRPELSKKGTNSWPARSECSHGTTRQSILTIVIGMLLRATMAGL